MREEEGWERRRDGRGGWDERGRKEPVVLFQLTITFSMASLSYS